MGTHVVEIASHGASHPNVVIELAGMRFSDKFLSMEGEEQGEQIHMVMTGIST